MRQKVTKTTAIRVTIVALKHTRIAVNKFFKKIKKSVDKLIGGVYNRFRSEGYTKEHKTKKYIEK